MRRSFFDALGIRQAVQRRVDSFTGIQNPSAAVPWTGYGGIAATGDHANSSPLTQPPGRRTEWLNQ